LQLLYECPRGLHPSATARFFAGKFAFKQRKPACLEGRRIAAVEFSPFIKIERGHPATLAHEAVRICVPSHISG
jgi:hypothetical protein